MTTEVRVLGVRVDCLDMQAALARIARLVEAGAPCRLYVTGSLVKGRFGANSDVDAVCDAPSHLVESKSYPHSDVHVMCRDGGPPLEAFGSHVEVELPLIV